MTRNHRQLASTAHPLGLQHTPEGLAVTNTHDHTWQTRSRHRTSEGTVIYQQCYCGRWQVRLVPCCVLTTTHDNHHLRLIAPPASVTDTPATDLPTGDRGKARRSRPRWLFAPIVASAWAESARYGSGDPPISRVALVGPTGRAMDAAALQQGTNGDGGGIVIVICQRHDAR
jgi:hypothetical protein